MKNLASDFTVTGSQQAFRFNAWSREALSTTALTPKAIPKELCDNLLGPKFVAHGPNSEIQ